MVAGSGGTGVPEGTVIATNFITHEGDLLDITVEEGVGSGTIKTTSEHPHWSVTLSRWVPAIDLRIGEERLWQEDGTTARVAALRMRPGQANMWNLTVDIDHTFYVSFADNTSPVLVHNAGWTSLGEGYSGRVDVFNIGSGVDFEIHVYRNGTEVGIFGSSASLKSMG